MFYIYAYTDHGNFCTKKKVGNQCFHKILPEDIFLHEHFFEQDDGKLTVISTLEEEHIFPSSVLLNQPGYIDEIKLSKEHDNILLILSNSEYKTNVKKYNLLRKKVLTERSFAEDVAYVFADGEKVLYFKDSIYNRIYIRSILSKKEEYLISNHDKEIECIAILSNGENLIASSGKDNSIQIWDILQKKCLSKIDIQSYASLITFQDSKTLMGWQGSPSFWIWSLEKKDFLIAKSLEENTYVTTLKLNHEKEYLWVGMDSGIINCYSTVTGHLIWSNELSKEETFKSINNIEICGDSLLVTCGCDGKIYVLKNDSGKLEGILSGHRGWIDHLVVLNQDIIISSGFDEEIRIWSLKHHGCIALLSGHQHRIEQMIMSADYQYLLTRDKLGSSIVWKSDWIDLINRI